MFHVSPHFFGCDVCAAGVFKQILLMSATVNVCACLNPKINEMQKAANFSCPTEQKRQRNSNILLSLMLRMPEADAALDTASI
jgi:hypothetical protein